MVKPDKEVKKWFKKEASKDPEKYYATTVLKERGFLRKKCACGRWFWTVNKGQDHCGDASCAGGFTLFENNPCSKRMDYVETWKEFSRMFGKKGYSVIPRYPVVARWNPTMEFTIASIASFQPYVVSGEVEPPAKELVIPQFCLRFGDVDNVGVTMSHMTGFVMIGQHAFVSEEEWDQNRYFTDILEWLTDGLGLPLEEITFHEDAWAGGGNFGPCMEFFSRGVELGNQVYMMFEQDDEEPEGYRRLKLKVLDMGMGHERNAWFSQGKGTIYDATFPTVIKKLLETTNVKKDEELLKKYIPVAAFLNLDEVEDIDEAWARVANEVGIPVDEIREKIGPLTAIYVVAEHARSLLFALADGALPSNSGGGYNLRMLYRRAQSSIERYDWTVDLGEVASWHAEYLAPLFPELKDSISEVKRILLVEKRKYDESKERAVHIIAKTLKRGALTTETLLKLYDEHGIQPSMVAGEAKRFNMVVEVPDNFYALLAERNTKSEQRTETKRSVKLPLQGLPKTEILFFDSWDYVDFESPLLAVIDGKNVILERTAFYPTSGGQEHDTGEINNVKVIDVFKQDGIIVHVLEKSVNWKRGAIVKGRVDIDRRMQLAQHHTSAHIINGAARKVLGNHVWQAGASKTTDKGRLDITHHDALTSEELLAIEEEANRIVMLNLPIKKVIEPKRLAEAEYGFRLYQGGAVPGKEIRVVEIPGFDTEACGGTHLNTTGEAGRIILLKSTKIQDGVVRIEYVAGAAAERVAGEKKNLIEELKKFLDVKDESLIPDAAEHLFLSWKAAKKGKNSPEKNFQPFKGDILVESAKRLRTQPEHILKTLRRFKGEIDRG